MPETEDQSQSPAAAAPPSAKDVHAAELYCEVCGSETPHRILRASGTAGTGSLRGTARCRVCRHTHTFEIAPRPKQHLRVIVSVGSRSSRAARSFEPAEVLRVGEPVPGGAPGELVSKLERPDGRSVAEAAASQLATVWAVSVHLGALPVSIVEGRRTRSIQKRFPPEGTITIGESIDIEGRSYRVTTIRARGRTWRFDDEKLPVAEVTRVYVRRNEIPPAGRRDWIRSRETPRARASSISRAGRSRSSPGDNR